ncbi:hypothetical protein [Algoriphagus chordae]|uniref:BNR repeat protein n=1 Tax=Algoriphagus chordae TaxID=237019 RepID=A0A2W7QLZ8_9BACT|nr:hypothetical protein [Algoriphagus chordae]PZX48316.1 hypothetical protein LV85_03727 [Algoriphagus chordae]
MGKIAKVCLFFTIVFGVSCSTPKVEPFQNIPFPEDGESALPYLFSGSEGLMMSWVKTLDDSTSQLMYSHLEGATWSQPETVLEGVDWFINWADFPSITENNGNLLTHFLQKSSKEKFSYDVKLNVLPKGSSDWALGLPLHTDSTFTEHGFVSAVPYRDDSFFVAWLDGRNTASSMDHGHSGHNGAMSIRAARVGQDGAIYDEALLDAKTCDCCQTTAAITDNGPIVIYRDRSEEELRDIAITRYVNGEWTAPQAVYEDGWEINGCPVNGPKVDAQGNEVVVAWFTGVNNKPAVKVAFSSDGGESFGEPIQVSGMEALGRVDVDLLDDNLAVVSWMETENGETYLKVLKVGTSGEKYAPVVVTQMDPARKSGFPQMEKVGDRLYFAWTSISEESTSIKTASLAISTL